MKAALFFLVTLMMVGASLQLGVLWTDQISGNLVNGNGWVRVEETIIDDNTVRTDFIDEIEEDDLLPGVSVEDSIFEDGSATVPENLTVGEVATIWGLLNANGGILADRGDLGGFSFKVEDNTGDTTINGTLFPNGGINADSGKFTVADETGETTIADALLRPNGGINVNNGKFVVDADDGDTKTEGNLTVELDIELGTTNTEVRRITRVPTQEDNGGDTHISGQSGTAAGGDLYIEPGCSEGATTCGDVIIGRPLADELFFGRADVTANSVSGGDTTFHGQNAPTGDGGDLILRAGDSSTNAQGGDLVLDPGHSAGGGAAGNIVLGTDEGANSNFDLLVTRPDVDGVNGGSTEFHGQDSVSGDGGDLIFAAGSTTGGATGGDLILQPGVNSAGFSGDIFLGRADNDEINVTRFTVSASAGDTIFTGQTSTTNVGGDIVFEAGSGAAGFSGGSVYLTTGVAGAGAVDFGDIILGNIEDPLTVTRPATAAAGVLTTVRGQDSTGGDGGDIAIQGGNGGDVGGNVQVTGGVGATTNGNVLINAGSGNTAGDIEITAGDGATGGNINLTTDEGNIVLEAGSNDGQVIVRNSNSFVVDGVTSILNGQVRIQAGSCQDRSVGDQGCETVTTMILSADPNAIIQYKDNDEDLVTLLRSRRDIDVDVLFQDPTTPLGPISVNDAVAALEALRAGFYQLLNALGPCGHGLLTYRDDLGNVVTDSNCALPNGAPRSRRGYNSGFAFTPFDDTPDIINHLAIPNAATLSDQLDVGA